MNATTLMVLFATATQTYNLPDGLLKALCWVESGHNAKAIHVDDGHSSSLGICQIKLETAVFLGFHGTARQLLDPSTNIHYAGAYLHRQLVRYGGDVRKGVAAYNAGRVNINASGEIRNVRYVNKVLTRWEKEKRDDAAETDSVSKDDRSPGRSIPGENSWAYPRRGKRHLRSM